MTGSKATQVGSAPSTCMEGSWLQSAHLDQEQRCPQLLVPHPKWEPYSHPGTLRDPPFPRCQGSSRPGPRWSCHFQPCQPGPASLPGASSGRTWSPI